MLHLYLALNLFVLFSSNLPSVIDNLPQHAVLPHWEDNKVVVILFASHKNTTKFISEGSRLRSISSMRSFIACTNLLFDLCTSAAESCWNLPWKNLSSRLPLIWHSLSSLQQSTFAASDMPVFVMADEIPVVYRGTLVCPHILQCAMSYCVLFHMEHRLVAWYSCQASFSSLFNSSAWGNKTIVLNIHSVLCFVCFLYLSQLRLLSFIIERVVCSLSLSPMDFSDGIYFSSFCTNIAATRPPLGLGNTFDSHIRHSDVMLIWVIFTWIGQWCKATLLPSTQDFVFRDRMWIQECWQWADVRAWTALNEHRDVGVKFGLGLVICWQRCQRLYRYCCFILDCHALI